MKFKDWYTKIVSCGWWASFTLFILQGFILDCLCACTYPWLGLVLFLAFTGLTFFKVYNKRYRFSPYSAMIKMFNKDS